MVKVFNQIEQYPNEYALCKLYIWEKSLRFANIEPDSYWARFKYKQNQK